MRNCHSQEEPEKTRCLTKCNVFSRYVLGTEKGQEVKTKDNVNKEWTLVNNNGSLILTNVPY